MKRLDGLDALELFLEIADAGGLRKAARRLDMVPSTLMRRMQALEADMGERLMERAGKGIRLTEAGRRLAVDLDRRTACLRLPPAAEGTEDAFSVFVDPRLGIRPVLSALHQRARQRPESPSVRVRRWSHELEAAAMTVRLIPAEQVRADDLEEPGRIVVAAPSALQYEEVPADPAYLSRRHLLAVEGGRPEWLVGPAGLRRRLPEADLLLPDEDALRQAALSGMGLAVGMSLGSVMTDLLSGALVQVLPQWSLEPMWLRVEGGNRHADLAGFIKSAFLQLFSACRRA